MNQLSSPEKQNSNPSVPKVDGKKSPNSKTQPEQNDSATDVPLKTSEELKEKTIVKDQKDAKGTKIAIPKVKAKEEEKPQSPKIPGQHQLKEWAMTNSQDNSLTGALGETAIKDKEEQKTQTNEKKSLDSKAESAGTDSKTESAKKDSKTGSAEKDSQTESAKKESKRKYHQNVDFKKEYEEAESKCKPYPKEGIRFFYHNRKPNDRDYPSVYFRFNEEKKIIALAARSKDEGYDKITGISPLNNYEEFKGVFLCATLFRNELPNRSPYGSFRYILHAEDLIMNDKKELKALYLAGFYQMYEGSPHYVILVLADKTISFGEDFKKLNFEENPFLTYKDGKLECLENSQGFPVYVEIFHVGDIALKEGRYSTDDKVLDTGRSK